MSVGLEAPSTSVDLAVLGEKLGFSSSWVYDSHILGRDPYPIMTLIGDRTSRMKIGTCVTNPVTRHWTVTASAFSTLNELSGGRMILGIGRGDAALRAMGRSPATIAELEESIRQIKALAGGQEVSLGDVAFRLPWSGHEVPVYVAAYGPRALRVAGRLADGVILQCADPFIIEWFLQFVRQGAREAGRDISELQVQCAAPGFVADDIEDARDQVRWFPALVAHHVRTLVRRFGSENIPKELADFANINTGQVHAYPELRRQYRQEMIDDELVDSFTVIGSAAACVDKLKQLEAVGVTEWNLYCDGVREPEKLLEALATRVIPNF